MYINLITIDLCPGQTSGGITPAGTLTISKNGMYNVYPYSSASVDVHPSKSLSETYLSNGSYTITGEFNGGMVTVNVPSPQFVTESLSVSANGTYTPSAGVDGYNEVNVDVNPPLETANITMNGTYVPSSEYYGFDRISVNVPQQVDGYSEKEITEGLNIVNLYNDASYVGNGVFYDNDKLKTVSLPNCLSVGYSAFFSCNNITSMSLPVCTSVGSAAFAYCTKLKEAYLPNCVILGYSAFIECYSLSSMSLPVCTSVGSAAFAWCHSLPSISLPVCTSVSYSTFYSCNLLTDVSLPNCSYVGYGAFAGCSSLTSISLPVCSYLSGGTGAYNAGCFEKCINLAEITIGTEISTVCVLGKTRIFSGCTALTSIYVPASLVESYKTATNWTYFSDKIVGI